MIRFALRDKTPREEDIYSINWAPYIGADVLDNVTSEVVSGGIIIDTETIESDQVSSFFIRGGTLGQVAVGIIKISTVAGRELDALVTLGIR